MNIGLLKKALAAVISAVIIAVSAVVPAAAADTFETAEKAVQSISAGWNLGNSLDSCGNWISLYTQNKPSDYEKAWGNPVTTNKIITTVKNAGFNAIRVPVTWAEHIDSSGNINKEWLDRVQEVVDYVISQDLYCIINVHHDAGSDGWLEASADCYKNSSGKFAGLWKNIAERFKDYGEKLMFESFNEILDSKDSWTEARESDAYKAVNDFNQLFVDTVRKTGGSNAQRNLMVQVYSASCTDKALNGFVLPKDSAKNHLIIQTHNYDPAGFTSVDATWTTMTDKWGTASDKSYFDNLFARLGSFSKKMGAPLIIGEFAAEFKENDSDRAAYAEYFVTAAAKNGIKCFWWDTGGMALIDRSKCTIAHPDVVNALTKFSAKGTASSEETSKVVSKKLPAPALTAKKGTHKVTLTWNNVDNAYRYRVYQYNPETKKYVRIKTVKGNSCTVKNLNKGSYKFIVCAVQKTDSGYKNGKYSKAVKVKIS